MQELTDFLCFQLGVAARKLHKYYNSKFSSYGITLTQSFIIFSLLTRDGQSIKSLAENLYLESPAVTGLVDRLEKEKLLERRADTGDRRALKVFLTPRGRELAEQLEPIANEFNERLKLALAPEQGDLLAKLMAGLDEAMEQ